MSGVAGRIQPAHSARDFEGPRRMSPLRITIGGAFFLFSSTLFAQAAQPAESPLDELLKTPISTAAKYDQPMSDVAASVTVITAEEIARNGWHTLSDALSATRGVYTTYDRAYTYLGVRGFGLPTDYNVRILLLLDGHPLLENVSSSAGIGTALAIDLSNFSRIEFIRGPGSVLYGTGAMFGVINLISKDEGESSSAMAGVGSDGLTTGSARGSIKRGAFRASVAVSWQESAGGNLYIPEFDRPDTNTGIVRGRDTDNYRSLLATAGWKDLRVLVLHSTRTKGVPTGSWGTEFGGRQAITDGRALVAADFEHRVGVGKTLYLRGYHDRFDYAGRYPHSGYDFRDHSNATSQGAEARFVWDVQPGNRLTLGGEYVDNRIATFSWYSIPEGKYQIGRPYGAASLYMQDEAHITPRLTLTAGARFDRYSNSGSRITPRGAAIFQLREGAVLKVLYGTAFRAPSVYELHYGDEPSTGFLPARNLRSEDIRTTELVWEQRLSEDLLLTTSLFDTKVQHLIRLDSEAGSLEFENMSSARSRGGELQVDYRRNNGLWSYLSYSRQRTLEQGKLMVNSPITMVKGGLSSSTARRTFGAVEMQYETGRLTRAGQTTDSVLLTNLNLGAKLTDRLSLSVTVRNAFDVAYATPGGAEHIQDTIAQDGRTFLLRLRVTGR
jgi:outer membrane receptor protein involved in Fe transport